MSQSVAKMRKGAKEEERKVKRESVSEGGGCDVM